MLAINETPETSEPNNEQPTLPNSQNITPKAQPLTHLSLDFSSISMSDINLDIATSTPVSPTKLRPSPIKHQRAPSASSTLRLNNIDLTDTQTIYTQLTSYDYAPGVKYEFTQGVFDEIPEFSHLDCQEGNAPLVSVESFAMNSDIENVERSRSVSIASVIDMAVDTLSQKSKEQLPGNFAVRMTGFIRIQQAGLYTFFLGSNDGSILYLASKKLIDNSGKVIMSSLS